MATFSSFPSDVFDLTSQLKRNFRGQYWEFEKVLGAGEGGFAVLLTEKGGFRGRMAVKLAKAKGVRDLQREIQILRAVNGAKHIVSMLGSCDDLPRAVKRRRARGGIGKSKIPEAFQSFVGLQGPALALEYLEYGTFKDLNRKLQETNPREEIPDRVLWSLLLCLFRASAGLAFPIGARIGSTPRPERVGNRWPLAMLNPLGRNMGYAHNDLHWGNVMLTRGDGETEHMLNNTVAKVIDLGLANYTDTAAVDNVWNAAGAVHDLIIGTTFNEEGVYLGKTTSGGLLLEPGLAGVDADLRGLLMRCLYQNATDRPTLREATREARNALRDRRTESFLDPDRETDDNVYDFMQRHLFDVGRPQNAAGFVMI